MFFVISFTKADEMMQVMLFKFKPVEHCIPLFVSLIVSQYGKCQLRFLVIDNPMKTLWEMTTSLYFFWEVPT